jgi:hypothetical protein
LQHNQHVKFHRIITEKDLVLKLSEREVSYCMATEISWPTRYFRFCYDAVNIYSIQHWSWANLWLNMRPIHVWRYRTPATVWCNNFPTVIRTSLAQDLKLKKALLVIRKCIDYLLQCLACFFTVQRTSWLKLIKARQTFFWICFWNLH